MSAIETDRGGVKTLVTIIVHSLTHSQGGFVRSESASEINSSLVGEALFATFAVMSNGSGNE
ncbi:hypothetical protein [Rhizobium wenxiniae]|uniref:hypothetical protein n=1 Tax=Rhizobium wenxiniae TaxID=1737357 RepID=UPI001C6EAF9E|nr:hypothetical protein [Rhizobium wenxiniae]